MTDHNGVLMMQRALLAGTLGLAMARKAAAILEGQAGQPGQPGQAGQPGQPGQASQPSQAAPVVPLPGVADEDSGVRQDIEGFREPQGADGAVLRAILDAANECLGHFDDRPPAERWCDTLFHLLDLAASAAELG